MANCQCRCHANSFCCECRTKNLTRITICDACNDDRQPKTNQSPVSVHHHIFKESILSHVVSIKRIIALYENDHMKQAKELIDDAYDLIIKGLSENNL